MWQHQQVQEDKKKKLEKKKGRGRFANGFWIPHPNGAWNLCLAAAVLSSDLKAGSQWQGKRQRGKQM